MAKMFAVELGIYAGPLDLLLYLVRREELDVTQVSLARITAQYLDFLEILEAIDVDATAEFLEPVGILIELKAREVIPTNQVEEQILEESPVEDPADQLVYRLIEYKRIRDAATLLDEQSRAWQHRFTRQADDLPKRRLDPGQQPIAHVEVWDLVSAFGRILRERQPPPAPQVIFDETPIHEYMQAIHRKVATTGRIELQALFQPGQHKSALVGLFLATLELTRHHGVLADQDGRDGPLWLTAGPAFREHLEVFEIDSVRQDQVDQSNLPVRPR